MKCVNNVEAVSPELDMSFKMIYPITAMLSRPL